MAVSIKEAVQGLDYQSESNHLWGYAEFPRSSDTDMITCSEVLDKFHVMTKVQCVEQNLEERFLHFIATQPQSNEYKTLYDALLRNLTGIKMFRVNPSRVQNFNFDLYVAGIDTANKLIIVYTSGVET